MNETSSRWHQITPSEFPWEREALGFVRQGLPDHEPYRAWANLEFLSEDGSIHEVDLLVLSPKGFYLVEIKSWTGTLEGDSSTWIVHEEGRVHTHDSPLFLANRKARRLASLLKRQKTLRGVRLPYLEPMVFLSDPGLRCKLAGSARQGVHLREDVIAALTRIDPADLYLSGRTRIDRPLAKAVSRALEEAGIRPTRRSRQVGDYLLESVLYNGPHYQDWQARHVSSERLRPRRVRIYAVAAAASAEARALLERAARREIEALDPISHPGVLKPLHLTHTDLGPALVFEHDPKAMRLDHYLKRESSRLGFADRLALIRQVAETLQYVHERRLYHRALSPQSILVFEPDGRAPRLRILDWQTAVHDALTTGASSRNLSGTSHLDQLVEDSAQVYVAPEAFTLPDASPEALDIFSLGALAYFLFSGRPPAESALELHDLLRSGQGLQLASVLDGVHPDLSTLVQLATHPVVAERWPSVTDFLGELEKIERDLARGEEYVIDPLAARAGDRFREGFLVKNRLGKGSTSVVFLVERNGLEHVLKVAVDAEADDRLRAEAEILKRLKHPRIVPIQETVTVSERFGLLLPRAADETLAQRLRREGRLQVELLQRFGEDLLQAMAYLEREGVPHRDVKPDNLGVAQAGRNKELHLVLFDFSLSQASADNIFAGTRSYLDPFLRDRKPRRWDLQAERFAVGVTLYEMATGTLPRWGDGQSDPAMIKDEVGIESELLDAAVREPLATFFAQALRRNPRKRFDNAGEMLAAWSRAFEEAERGLTTPTTTEEQLDELAAASSRARPDTSVSLLHLSTRAVNALERARVINVHDLLKLPTSEIHRMRGVGSKTRKELLAAIRLLSENLGQPMPPPAETVEIGEPGEISKTTSEVVVIRLDLLVRQLLPTKASGERRILEAVFGLSEEAPASASSWPSQSDVAAALSLTRARVSQILVKARQRWLRSPSLGAVRDDVAKLIQARGGAATIEELSTDLTTIRGAAVEERLRLPYASAVLRAATEAEESSEAPRWVIHRSRGRILLALADPQGEALMSSVEALGRKADELAAQDPLPSPQRALEELQALARARVTVALNSERLLRLAASMSRNAAVSSRMEIYPRDLPASRALRLASGSLLGGQELTVDDIRNRIASRFPEAPPLPGRPELDDLLDELGLGLRWDRGVYRLPPPPPEITLSSTTTLQRLRTAPAPPPLAELSPEQVDARIFEDRLSRAAREGAFLALIVDSGSLLRVEEELCRRFPVDKVSLEERWLDSMHRLAREFEVDWDFVLRADARPEDDPDALHLRRFAAQALEPVEADLARRPRTVLLTRTGLLARYGQMDLVERLRDGVSRRPAAGEAAPPGVWLLIPAEGSATGPEIDGATVLVPTPAQWARIPKTWIQNGHRSQPEETA